MTRNTQRTCANCGTGANKVNMGPNANGELLCSDCYTSPVSDDALEMPTVEEVLNQ